MAPMFTIPQRSISCARFFVARFHFSMISAIIRVELVVFLLSSAYYL